MRIGDAYFPLIAFVLAGCEVGPFHDATTQGPPVRLVGANVGPTKPLPADGTVRLSFDRPLDPATVTRQSVVLLNAYGRSESPAVVTYDPVSKVVSLSSPNPSAEWLVPDHFYSVRIAQGDVDAGTPGLRAIDGAPADPQASGPIGFNVVAGPDGGTAVPAPAVSFCRDVLPLFQERCATRGCHGGAAPRMGLLLESTNGVAKTAVGRVASQSNSGPLPRVAVPQPGRFGLDMALLQPRSSGTSYLLYKLLLLPAAAGPGPDRDGGAPSSCLGPAAGVAGPADLTLSPWTESDRRTLGEYIEGHGMPYSLGPGTFSPRALRYDELQTLRVWIDQGAKLEQCAPCTITP